MSPDFTKYRRSKSQPNLTGFTLIELLVVISIVAVLLAITMPSFQHAREVSQQLKCRANMRAVTQGAQFYAADNRGFGPPTTQNNPYQWHRPTTSSYTDTRGRVCPPVRGMASYFGYEDDVPANNRRFYYGSLGCPQYKNEGTVGISDGVAFGGNHYILGMADTKSDPTVRDFWVRLDDARVKPSINMLFFETYNARWNDVSFSLKGRPNSPYRWSPRHLTLGGLNYAFVDGHAKYIRWEDIDANVMATTVPGVTW